MKPAVQLLLASVVVLALGAVPAHAAPTIPWNLVAERPRDPNAYTQGLVAYRGVLLESTGQYGESSIRRVDPRTGRVLAQVDLEPRYFGEGLTVLRGRAVQLTWLERRVFRWDPATLAARGSQAYRFEGWGLATNGRHLIASDGSATVRWLHPTSLRVVRSVRVRDGRRAVFGLNELEYRSGVLWANVFGSDRIALIDPRSGRVRAWLDMARLRGRITSGGVLNGIARDPVTGRMIVTGKDWPRMFVIRLAGRIPPA